MNKKPVAAESSIFVIRVFSFLQKVHSEPICCHRAARGLSLYPQKEWEPDSRHHGRVGSGDTPPCPQRNGGVESSIDLRNRTSCFREAASLRKGEVPT